MAAEEGLTEAEKEQLARKASKSKTLLKADARIRRWQTSREGERTVKTEIRKALKKFGLPATGEPFDRAYNYVAENY